MGPTRPLNAAFVISQPERYVFETDSGPVAGKISDYLIRAYPQKHIKSLRTSDAPTPSPALPALDVKAADGGTP